jgi:signal transduction histidine kinase
MTRQKRRRAFGGMPNHGRSPLLPSALPALRAHRRVAFRAGLLVFMGLVLTVPFAQINLPRFAGIILIQNSLLFANDLLTAVLLLAQYRVGRSLALNVLAAGYLFTAVMSIPHALSFPEVFTQTGLLGGGSQSTPWLYVAWHSALPLAIIAYALRRSDENTAQASASARIPIFLAIFSAIGLAAAITLLVTQGREWLPALVEHGRLMPASKIVVAALLLLPAAALLSLTRRREPSLLDIWLMVVMFAWLCTIALVSFVSSQRFDLGWYAGRLFDWLTSAFILLLLIFETVALYARSAIERRELDRRVNELEAILVHLSRISELGQNVSSLIHEVNQPLSAISNYIAASVQIAKTSKPDRLTRILERAAEQAERASKIIQHLRDFIARREPEKRVENLREILNDGIRLASFGFGARAPIVDTRCTPAAAMVFVDRIQIEQVVFNLLRNAIEAMENSARSVLTVEADISVGNMIEVRIADTGPGLPPEIREKLFEPFVTGKAGGLGLGLSICRIIVEAHGGRLKADNNPGGGAVFRFTLPQASAVFGAPPCALI